MFWIRKKDSEEEILEKDRIRRKQDSCEHKHFTIYGHNLLGDATCIDCGKTERMYIYYNRLTEKLIDLADKLEKKLGE